MLLTSCSSIKETNQVHESIPSVVISIWDSSFQNSIFRDSVLWIHSGGLAEVDTPKVVKSSTPISLQLLERGPNPFSPPSNILFRVNKIDTVEINITTTDSLSASTNVLLPQGDYRLFMNDLRIKSGVYFFKIVGRDTLIQKKMIYLR